MILLDDKEIEEVLDRWEEIEDTDGKDDLEIEIDGYRFVTKAAGKKILIQLQAIYNIPDLKAEDVRMGEFIQELMEEVNGE